MVAKLPHDVIAELMQGEKGRHGPLLHSDWMAAPSRTQRHKKLLSSFYGSGVACGLQTFTTHRQTGGGIGPFQKPTAPHGEKPTASDKPGTVDASRTCAAPGGPHGPKDATSLVKG